MNTRRETMKLRAIDIPIDALKIFAKNSNLIFFAALFSLPLFLFSLYFENRLQSFLVQTSHFLHELINETPEFRQTRTVEIYITVNPFPVATRYLPLEMLSKLSNDRFGEFLHLGFLYLVPFNLLHLVSVIVVVDLASKLYREERALTLKDMFGMRFSGERLGGIFVTFLCVALFSTCILCGFILFFIIYGTIAAEFPILSPYSSFDVSYFFFDLFIHSIYGFNLPMLIGLYLAWSAIWNLGLVVSVLEGKYMAKALGNSAYLCLRNLKNGMVLMLVFSLWELGLRGLDLFSIGSDKGWGFVVAQSGFFCLGSALKWVGFVVYFEDCIKRLYRKKVDVGVEESR